ncbi:mucin-17-like [Teleopsis dalmanni]|uniref:mucin-17-like n=1 Tax=Teleopsis dalmanni TaxID=139649 RepID=UPI0018CE9224|nr:mucin-17-like [Teleopsis dalmanni]
MSFDNSNIGKTGIYGSPSPRKKRNNSTPVKKNATEKKQILQQLVSPAVAQAKPKVSLDELISMSENRLRVNNIDSESDLKETTFSENSGSLASGSMPRNITDPKLEKKVTFARLLNKVSAEMSSGSEIDIGQMGSTRNSSALSLPTDIQFRASSMPPSPCTNDIRSPHSTSSNQGSDSLSSSDLALTDFGLRSIQNSGSEIGGTSHQLNSLAAGIPARCRIGSPARPKVSSADSILAMFRNFGSISTTASITANNIMPSTTSIFISPSTTPTVSSPQDDAPGDDESSTSSMHTPVSFSSGPPDSPVFYRQTTIEVPVLDVLNAHKTSSPSSSTSSSSTNLLHPPTILLEIPSNGINNKCLSPIREMPTPIPSPALTPIMPRPQRSNSPIFQEDPLSSGDFSDDEIKSERSERSDAQLSERLLLGLQRNRSDNIDTDVETTPTDTTTTCMADINKPHPFNKLPLLHISPAPTLPMNALIPPMITIDVEPPTPEDKAIRPRDLIIPTLTVEQPSPTKNRYPMIIFPGSPPPQRASIGETSFMFPNKQQQKRLLKQFEKPTSLDFPFVPPMITITSNMSEMESDNEPMSPAVKTTGGGGLMPPNPVGMCYLSPFTMCGRADRTISESNLSSSGYSSMASPGPSRCGSSNPLCPNEMDEPGSGHSGAGLSLHVNLMNRRRNSALSSCKENITNGKSTGTGSSGASGSSTDRLHGNRQRSDSETFSDDILLESNDEGIGTDHVDEKLEDNRLNNTRLRELDVFMEEQILIEVDEPQTLSNSGNMLPNVNQMSQLQLPSIVIQIDGNEKGLSPVSSRSESPLSDRAGLGRFSPHFYGRKDQLPFTDSDGLYDFPSSDGKGASAHSYTHQRRSSSKKRERKSSKCSTSQSPTKQQLEVPSKESLNTNTTTGIQHVCNKHCHSHNHPCPAATVTTRKSPKRRILNRLPIASSSSSSESLTSTRELSIRPLPRRLNSPNKERKPRKQESLSEDEVADALLRRISPSIVKEVDVAKPKCKINRLRAIGNQIRFLRRLEKSIKTRERLASASDSCPEENTDDMDSPQATSPLLQPTSPNKTRVALCRQKRLPGGTYGITASALSTSSWKGMDRSLIGDDLNSD